MRWNLLVILFTRVLYICYLARIFCLYSVSLSLKGLKLTQKRLFKKSIYCIIYRHDYYKKNLIHKVIGRITFSFNNTVDFLTWFIRAVNFTIMI